MVGCWPFDKTNNDAIYWYFRWVLYKCTPLIVIMTENLMTAIDPFYDLALFFFHCPFGGRSHSGTCFKSMHEKKIHYINKNRAIWDRKPLLKAYLWVYVRHCWLEFGLWLSGTGLATSQQIFVWYCLFNLNRSDWALTGTCKRMLFHAVGEIATPSHDTAVGYEMQPPGVHREQRVFCVQCSQMSW